MTVEIRDQFAGIAPAISPRKLPEPAAQVATNVTFDGGKLKPLQGILEETILALNAQSIFYRNETDGWLVSERVRDYVRPFVAADAFGLTYFTDGVQPRFVAAGSTALYDTGIPRPNAPTIEVADSGDLENPLLTRNQSYVAHWVDGFGRVGPTSLPTNAVNVGEGSTVTINRPPLPSGQFYAMGGVWRVFRSNTGSNDVANYQFVDELPLTTTVMSDGFEPDQLTYVAFSDSWVGPPAEMTGLMLASGDFLMGFTTNEVYASEVRVPHAWPYSWGFQEQVRGIAAIQGGVLVVTDGRPWLLAGSSPQNLQKVPIESHAACLSSRSLVDMGDMAIYAGKDGLYGASGTQVQNLTEGGFDEDSWSAYQPETIIGFRYENYYVGVYGTEGKGFLFDFQQQKFVDLTGVSILNTAFNPWTQTTHVLYRLNGQIRRGKFDQGALLTGIWRSRQMMFPALQSFSAIRVQADEYPVTVRVFDDYGSVELQVANDRLRKLPSGFKSRSWAFELEVTGGVDLFVMATSTGEIV